MLKIIVIISIFIIIWFIICQHYNCFKQKEIKTNILKATREELGKYETKEASCLSSLIAIDSEISQLRDQIKKITEESYSKCLLSFEKKIDIYDALQKRLYKDQPNSSDLILSREQIKRKFYIE